MSSTPDAILVDISLPDKKRATLIAVTGWNKGSEILAQIPGFDHHVGKPYDPEQHSLAKHSLGLRVR